MKLFGYDIGLRVKKRELLTPREIDIMCLVSKGLARKQAGDKLGIKESTVRSHLSTIYRKLNAASMPHAVYICVKKGLIK